MNLSIDKIKINGRHRRDLGDVKPLAESIQKLGLLQPVVVNSKNELIAGERRIAAARSLGWKEIPATIAETINDALLHVTAERDENTCRKDFAPSEAVAVADAMETLERPQAKERQGRPGQVRSAKFAEHEKGETRKKVAAAVGMSHTTLTKARAVTQAAKDEPEKFATLKDEMDRTGKVDKAYRRVNAKRISDAPAKPIPTGTFDLILADPPWKYDASETETRHLDNQYPTMDDGAIENLRPPAATDAVLFLWATAPKLVEALDVLLAWGFKYRTSAVWDKEKIGMGYWFRGQHELLLVGVKGKFSPPDQDRRVSSVFRVKRGAHSEKPAEVYETIERMFPKARRLEMFARSEREGWTAWGNEVVK